MTETVTISILGICVSRDIFGMHENDGGYVIEGYVHGVSPLSAVSSPISYKKFHIEDPEWEEMFDGLAGFYKRILEEELNREIFPYLKKFKSDWLLIDAGAIRYDLVKFQGDSSDEPIYFTNYDVFVKRIKKTNKIFPDNISIVSVEDITDDEFSLYMERYAQEIIRQYNEDKIIINEIYPVAYYIDGNLLNVYEYDLVLKQRKNVERMFNFLKTRFPKAHIIEFPEGVISDLRHKWGHGAFHYIPEYYDYGLEAMKLITGKELHTIEDEQCALQSLKKKYEKLLQKKYEPLFVNNIKYFHEKNNLCMRMIKYKDYLKELLVRPEKIINVFSFFSKNNISHCAFYGASEICRTLIPIFQNRAGICIDYIVEDLKEKTLFDTPVISRNAPSYPATQVMIIADVMSTGKIKEKLKKRNVPFPVYDVYEILEF